MIINQKIKIFLIFGLPLIASTIIVYTFKISDFAIIKSEFLIQFLGLFLGFIFTILAFIFSMTESIKNQLINAQTVSETAKEKQFKTIDDLYSEIKDDTKFVFILFCISIIICFLESINFNVQVVFLNKTIFLNILKLTILFLSIYAIYEIMEIMFKISKAASIYPKK